LGVSPATIRNEMQDLIERGYLYQPHTSAGRVPTDKGYRFLVDIYKKDMDLIDKRIEREIRKIRKEIENELSFVREFTRFMAQSSSKLTISYLKKEGVVMKEGWSFVLSDPEFDDAEKIRGFAKMVSEMEDNIDKLHCGDRSLKVYIGGESPFNGRHDFAIMISPYFSKRRKKGFFAIMGPKRMDYDKNMRLVSSITKFLREI